MSKSSTARKRKDHEWRITPDGTIVDRRGKVIYFSIRRFVSDICLGDKCFICGADPNSTQFNNEHVLPEWLLRRFGLFNKKLTLPNGHTVRYDRYTVPCCVSCNKLMGKEIEEPIRALIAAGPKALNDFVRKHGPLRLFVWLGLIFLKTHLRDKFHRVHLDHRQGDQKIGDAYDWHTLHHIHTVVRCFFVGSRISPAAIGSFAVLPTKPGAPGDEFDYADLFLPKAMLIRLNDVAIVTVFNDSCAALGFYKDRFQKITGPLSGLQLREIMVDMAFINLLLKQRPVFSSDIDLARRIHHIQVALPPKPELEQVDLRVRGSLLHHAFKESLPSIKWAGHSKRQILSAIRAGTFSVLFDEKGNFMKDSLVIIPRTGSRRKRAKA